MQNDGVDQDPRGGLSALDTQKTETTQDTEHEKDEKTYPPKKIVLPAMAAIYLAFFLVALDRTIIGTAIPAISNQFNSFGDVAWYESGFLLPLCALQLSFGLIYTYYSSKWVLIILVSIFEIGSIVCAAAPNSNALIVGRVIQGIGGAGIGSGAIILISMLVPLQARPQWTGGVGAVFGLASILGPLLGGYLTSVSWRWCFWINVPIGAVSLACLVFFTPNSPPAKKAAPTWRGKLDQLDPLGFVLIAPSVICLLFAIEWGGSKYPWGSGRVIALFVVFAVLLLAFIASQIWRGDKATLPPRILKQRTIFAASVATVGVGSVLVIYAFYLPIWFQVIQGKSPQKSGLSLLPLLLSNVIAVIAGGVGTSLLGYYTPFLIIGSAIAIVGSALLTTWTVGIGAGIWIGYQKQIVLGAGMGMVLQGPNIAAQTVLPDSDVSIGLSFLQFITFFAGSTFVTVSQTLLEHGLVSGLWDILPDLDTSMIAGAGATAIRDMVSTEQLLAVLKVYNDSMRSIWYLGLGLSCLMFIATWGFEWKSVKSKKEGESEVKA
ncbi:MFS general substrate transporter [Aureobasidium subglaciale]|nr:MFS general substrate transporter [Aureobasidium subglaciale]KAI5216820.1 MFS general substrate transporter [Aureobasidium subglaciale]KAI5220004.1 MFS general substrate transporter [Aureobasidium subglaciale]KAI5257879.1 MFS general substrate transporter [Aureobasidium subglaciale]